VAPHQDAILGPPQMRDAHGEPNSDRQKGHGECEGCDVGQHAMAEVVGLVPDTLLAGQVIRHFELANRIVRISTQTRHGDVAPRPELEHAMLIV